MRLTPHGHLLIEPTADGVDLDDPTGTRLVQTFARGSGPGLLQLGAGEVGRPLPPSFTWWRGFAARYVAALCLQGSAGEGGRLPDVPAPDAVELTTLALTAPMMPGAEYLGPDRLRALWRETASACAAAWAASGGDLQSFLQGLNPAWNLVGRVHFNLAENRRDADAPFAFLATYTTRLSAQGKAQHVPLGQALRDSGSEHRSQLLTLLLPVQRAAATCAWLRTMVDDGAIFHPLRWSPAEAARLLASAAELKSAGVVVRMPAGWRAGRPARPQVTGVVGARQPSAVGLDGLLDFRMSVTLGGAALSDQEIATLLQGTDSLVLLRGQWVEVDRARLERAMRQFREAEALAAQHGLSFAAAMRMLADAAIGDRSAEQAASPDWAQVTAGPWLAETLRALRTPDGAGVDPGAALRGTLRPYQRAGLQWLHLLAGLGLGACLADDMGLGKTIQVLSLLLLEYHGKRGPHLAPSLLV
ncbi:MAG TPA: SNF2 helicase-associated domain-containing protein, partial [Acetobacteraceae bacterium]|nr:SNF2 helicase-associated domain-containing protein [Acetobacteraceae bacterium]